MKESKISQVKGPASKLPQSKPSFPQRMLVFSSQRLLTEKSSITVNPFLLGEQTETLTNRATMATVITAGIQGRSHCGFKD